METYIVVSFTLMGQFSSSPCTGRRNTNTRVHGISVAVASVSIKNVSCTVNDRDAFHGAWPVSEKSGKAFMRERYVLFP